MAQSTGIIIAAGGISFGNKWLLEHKDPDFKILLATGVAAVMLAGAEHISTEIAVGIAWIALITTLLAPVGSTNSPVVNLLKVTGLGNGQI
jgi:hypothetical protein